MNWNIPRTPSRALDSILLTIILLSVYCLGVVIYNVFFHPLRSIPGPPLAKISKLWSRYGNLKGRKSHRIHAAHQRYGSVVRVAPNELSFSSPEAVRDIYTSDAFVKEETFYRAKRVFHEEMLMSFRDSEAHKQRKKLLQRGFNQAAMTAFESSIDTKIEALLDQWSRKAKEQGGTVDVYPWLLWLAFDIVYHLMFDEDPASVKEGQAHWVMSYMRSWRGIFIYKEFSMNELYADSREVPQLEVWGTWVPGTVGDHFRSVQAWKEFATSLIRSCRTRDTKTPLLHTAMTGTDGFLGRPLTDSELAEESMGGMFGGSGTTANTLAYLLWATLQQPDVVGRLKAELREAYPDPTKIPDAALSGKLPLLQAVINETLRLYPTIIASLPRTAVRDAVVAGVNIPQGAVVGTQNYTIHRNEEAFANAEKFIPDRWLAKEAVIEISKDAFIPFSIGTRSCIGINLARMELNKLTAAFFLRFDAHIDPSMTEADMEMLDVFSASPVGGKLLLTLRDVKI